MVIDIELTLNRFGFGRIAENKFHSSKHSISFEINWKTDKK